MGQHHRTVSCTTCPATAPLKVAKASWRPRVGRGGGTSPATWTCPACVERQRRPAPSFLSSIKLKPRPPSALAELAAQQRPRQLEAEELMKLGQASAAAGVAREAVTAAEKRRRDLLLFGRHTEPLPPGPPPRPVPRSLPALRGRMQIIAAAAMLGLVGLPAIQRRDFGWLADLRAFLNTLGSPCIGTISTDEAAQLGDHETIEAMCANGLTVVALPTHPQTHGDRVAVEIRIA